MVAVPIKNVLTTCPFCGTGCNFYLKVKDGLPIGVLPSRNHPVSRGRLCVKGWNAHEFITHPERLREPLIKTAKGLRPASWQKAIKFTADNLQKIRDKYGPDSIGVIASARCTNEENYLFQKFTRAVLGTNNIDHCARTCHSPTVTGLMRSFGSGAATNSIDELPDAKCILIVGSNSLEAHPIIGWRIRTAKDKGSTIILVDPRKTDIGIFSDLHLKILPGTDVALINAMMNVILAEGLEDKDFISRRTEGFLELEEAVKKYTPEYAQEITKVPSDLIIKAARTYAKTKPASIVYGLGITEHTKGTDNVSSLANLAMLMGNVGKPSSGVNPLRGQCNVQGSCDMGALPNYFPGYQLVEDEVVRNKFEEAWQVKLPPKKGMTSSDLFKEMLAGKIKALYVIGEDIVMSEPNSTHIIEGLKKLEFMAVHDLFMCKSAEFADVVFPASSYAEKDGTFANADRRVQRLRQAFKPMHGTLPDGEIIIRVAKAMSFDLETKNPKEIMDEIARLTPIYGGVSYERLDSENIQWPCPDKTHPGTKTLHQKEFSRGRGKFFAIEYRAAEELPDEEYPFILSTGRILFHYNVGTMTQRTKILSREFPDNFVQINDEDAKRLEIKNGDFLKVSTRRGALNVKAKVTPGISEGVVWMPFHFAQSMTNFLTNDVFDPLSKIGEYKVCAAKIEKI